MAPNTTDGLGPRLRRLPGQILLALVNGTVVLIIAAAILTLVAMSRAERFVADVSAAMTDTVLTRLDLVPGEALGELRGLRSDIQALRAALADVRPGEQLADRADLLRARLDTIEAGIDKLVQARIELTEAAIDRVGAAVSDALTSLRNCTVGRPPGEGPGPSAGLVDRPISLGIWTILS